MAWEPGRRGTSNANDRGSSRQRKSRRMWLLETWEADEKLNGQPTCRCFRCGTLLVEETMTIDRIKPGAAGGTYARDNIRPACGECNRILGAKLQAKKRRLKMVRG